MPLSALSPAIAARRKLGRIVVILATLGACPALAGAATMDEQIAALQVLAERNDPQAQMVLAEKYEHAEGVAKDFQKANKLYCLAARQGLADAQFKLGWIYANGRGVPRNDAVAAALFSLAAEQGHVHAGRLLQYVRGQPDTPVPSCMFHDPAPPATAGTEDAEEEGPPGPETVARAEVRRLVERHAPGFGLDPKLVLAVIATESSFNAGAVSPKNAQGLMQLIPETAARFGVKNVFNPVDNIRGGMAYLRWLLAFFQGNVTYTLAAYNAGEKAVERFKGVPPFDETRNYVKKISGIYRKDTHPFDPAVVEPSPLVTRPSAPARVVRN